MRIISKDNAIHTFNAAHPPKCQIESGEIFWIEVEDAYRGQITDPSVKRPDLDTSKINWSTGPIAVKDAMPGDVLCIEFLDFEFGPQGVMPSSMGLGLLGDLITQPDSKIIPIRDGYAIFSEEIHLPLTPMAGVCAVAPRPGLDLRCSYPGEFGGNLDTTKVTVGSKLYLPVFNKEAGLCIGDFHACMGDGEVSGTAIETPGRGLVRVTLRKDCKIERPVIETAEAIYFLASAETLDECVKIAVKDGIDYLMRKLELNFPDAYRLFSAACDTQISQVVNPLKTARARCPRFHEKIGRL
ncbi:acetamidase/formamidase family protein [[Clostridium] symbiosum]|uniref:acetamidase/formamidase family protein n=1 Tax=Clostridium symbiosum TaxID=1512 RepID=UPI001D067549|nr:acetamidase/formamidase family protein [[Clostridium] symbiosum]MCB6610910.1 acetamidase/formamidase family protein [[Clostridium] symbiosum]MCB6933180.1 acetamidase/formamidase family protein [[Clostridium] symbiosum]